MKLRWQWKAMLVSVQVHFAGEGKKLRALKIQCVYVCGVEEWGCWRCWGGAAESLQMPPNVCCSLVSLRWYCQVSVHLNNTGTSLHIPANYHFSKLQIWGISCGIGSIFLRAIMQHVMQAHQGGFCKCCVLTVLVGWLISLPPF